jgi:hypothetical protein
VGEWVAPFIGVEGHEVFGGLSERFAAVCRGHMLMRNLELHIPSS